jgi:hypothetical protein
VRLCFDVLHAQVLVAARVGAGIYKFQTQKSTTEGKLHSTTIRLGFLEEAIEESNL